MVLEHQDLTGEADTLSCQQVIPGISYEIMAGKEENGHQEIPGDAFNLGVLPASTVCFSALGTLIAPAFPFSHSFLLAWGVWQCALRSTVAMALHNESLPLIPTEQQHSTTHESNTGLQLELTLADVFTYSKRLKE